ncbi:MAG: DUF2119 family protein [Candidatus Hodarchaeota archaeon]
MFKIIGLGKPVRLFVGGLHGSEGIVTEPILREVSKEVEKGSLILRNFSKRTRYISTLCLAYYQTKTGKSLLSLIRKHMPEIYIELHSYRRNAYSKLTAPNRKEKIGVPPFTDLEDEILLGSVSPHIRTSEFRKHDLCLTLDIPADLKDTYKVIKILNWAIASRDKFEFLEKLRARFPAQVQTAEKKFFEYFKDIEPL